jgi:thymidylate kinase
MGKENIQYGTFDGLDATGKGVLLEKIHERTSCALVHCPPPWMRPMRTHFDGQPLPLRFLFYSFGNWWTDRIVRNLIHTKELILQDRSWLSTLTAHDVRGLSALWLNMGVRIARHATIPDTAFIMHVEPSVRRQRLMDRSVKTETDMQNFQYEVRMNQGYKDYALRLHWPMCVFDNTNHTIGTATESLLNYLKSANTATRTSQDE